MTARHNIRIGNRRLGRDRAAIDATPAPRVGEMLEVARERKGVDLFRAERDTKIRLKYLSALEDSDYGALPPLVYTKGFLRNYAIYLGLDPEDILGRWRDETQVTRKQERPAVTPPPQPLAAPRRGIAITPALLVAVMFSLVVVAVFAWIGWQLIRFADVPNVSLTAPTSLVTTIDAPSTVLTGTAGPRAEITVTTPDSRRMTVIADESGNWSLEVQLAKGRNDFTIVATDAVTHRPSQPLSLIVNVPLPGNSPGATAAPTPAPVSLVLNSPNDGLSATSGLVTVTGTTNGTRVTIQSTYMGSADQPPPTSPVVNPSPSSAAPPTPPPATATPQPGGSPAASTPPAASPPPLVDLTVDSTGRFTQSLTLPAGRWQLTITASAASVAPVVQTRTVTIQPAVAPGLTVVVTATRDKSWLHAVVDGHVVKADTWGGPTLAKGASATFVGLTEIVLDTGRPLGLDVSVNGTTYQLTQNAPHWVVRAGQAPQPTNGP